MSTLPINELRKGDIVLAHGMRILLDRDMETYGEDYGNPRPVYQWDGQVLNADDICDPYHEDYDAYLARWLRPQDWHEEHPHRDRWRISGSTRARWTVASRAQRTT